MSRVETLILANLIHNEEYARKTLPFLNRELFLESQDSLIFDSIQRFYTKYSASPTKESIRIDLDSQPITETLFQSCVEQLESYDETKDSTQDLQWLLDTTETFCKDRSVYNAIMESIHIIDGKSKTQTKNAIPEILANALAVSFDTNIGHDFLEDAEARYEFYHKKEERVSFDLSYFNRITDGGTPNKTLNVILAGTGCGKSMFMCHHAAHCLSQNMNVLYITCEMSEERIAERIDANLMDITLDELKDLPKQIYAKKIQNLANKIKGKLIIKEYPTSVANVTHFRHLLNELKMKRKFEPDVIFIDYLNICSSSRMKMGASINSYTYVKAIAEELRGLAVEMNVPLWTATQTNRVGFASTDIGLENTSESFGLPATADFMFALIVNEEMEELGQILVKQLKNRYNDLSSNKRFVVGVNRAKMKFYDVEEEAQADLIENREQDEDKFNDWKY
jgi:replicative DNA helicase